MSSNANINAKLATLNTLQPMLEQINSGDPAVTALSNVLTILISQVIELKADLIGSGQRIADTETRSAKTEQYSRRNTTVLAGLPLDPSESKSSQGNLADNVVKHLTKETGITISKNNISAVHRNGPIKVPSVDGEGIVQAGGVKTRSGSGGVKTKPGSGAIDTPPSVPSVTVCFRDTNLKDRILKSYRNFDPTAKKSKPIRLYQSLSPYYKTLKSRISTELKEKLKSDSSELTIRWIHWRSAGFCCKLSDDRLLKGISSYDDFKNHLINL